MGTIVFMLIAGAIIYFVLNLKKSDAPKGTEQDNWEGAFWDVESPRSVSANLRLNYRDGQGNKTTRDVEVWKYGPWEGGAILIGHCRLRNDTRTFRTDRIVSCTDLDTGEIVGNLESWLDAKWDASPERAIQQVMENAWDAVRVLFYISKADGSLTQKERVILRDSIRSISEHPELDDARIDGLIKTLDNPSITAFKQAFGRLVKRNDGLAQKVVAWADEMVATQKTIAPAEEEALSYMRARIAKG